MEYFYRNIYHIKKRLHYFPVNISHISQYSCSKVWKQHSQLFCKILVFKNFTKFKGKHWCRSIFLIDLECFFNKVVDLWPANLLKGNSSTGIFLQKSCGRLFLKVICENLHLTFIKELFILKSPTGHPPSPILKVC